MRKLFLSSLIIFTIHISAYSQNISRCPMFYLLANEAGIMDGKVSITANVDDGSRGFAGTLLDNIGLKERLDFKWKISPEFESVAEKPWLINLKNVSGSGGIVLSATVEIGGLPANCQNIFSESFNISFPTVIGDPPKIDEFGKISISEERKRLDAVASAFKDCQECSMTIILYSPFKNSQQSIKNRIARVSRYLTDSHKIPESSYEFINGGIGQYSTEIWFIPSFASLPNNK